MVVYVTFPNSPKQYAYKTSVPMEIGSKYRIVNARGNNYDNAEVLVVNKLPGDDTRATSAIVRAELVSATKQQKFMPNVKEVIYNNPATIVFWEDGTKTIVKCAPEDKYNKMVGFLLCVMKKAYGNTGAYNDILDEFAPYECLKQNTEKYDQRPEKVIPIELIKNYLPNLESFGNYMRRGTQSLVGRGSRTEIDTYDDAMNNISKVIEDGIFQTGLDS